MYEPFPTNYTWSSSVNLALGCGGEIGEVDEVVRALAPAANSGDWEAWDREWHRLAERVAGLAARDAAAGHTLSAGDKYLRAAAYRFIGERQVPAHAPRKLEGYKEFLADFARGLDLSGAPVERVEVPYEGTSMPALFVPAPRPAGGRAPTMIYFDGLDICKEVMWLVLRDAFARRGISCLMVDTPGVGEMLRLRGVPSRHDYEVPARACVDYLQGRPDVAADRIGIMAISLGGYYAPRAAAFEPRLRCCVAWGAIWDYHATWQRRRNLRPDSPVSVPAFQIAWVLGVPDFEAALEKLKDFTLADVMPRITCPLLIVHGEEDRQIPLADAEQAFRAATGTAVKELKVFTKAEGGTHHCQLDNRSLAVDYITDWVADHL
jgi:dienelactone hydrolase